MSFQFIGNDEFWYDAFVYVYDYAAVGIAMAIITIVQVVILLGAFKPI